MPRIPIVRVLVGAALVALLPGVGAPEVIDRILGVAAGQVITLSDVRGAIDLGLVNTSGAADPVDAALNQLIERELILAEVERYQPAEPAAEAVQERFDVVRARLGNVDALASALAASGLSERRLRDYLRNDLRIEAYLEQRFAAAAQPTDDEVTRYYREHQAEFVREGVTPPLAEVRETIRTRLAGDRRRALIAEWVVDLRRRGNVTSLYLPG